MRQPLEIKPYARKMLLKAMNSVFMFFRISRCRTGRLAKRFRIETVVPWDRGHIVLFVIRPKWSSSNLVPNSADEWRVVIVISDTAQSELNASPRKPNVLTSTRSLKLRIFDVWCLAAAMRMERDRLRSRSQRTETIIKSQIPNPSKFGSSTPDPLSMTSMPSAPCSRSLTSINVAPASNEFSTNSFTAMAKFKMTCNAKAGGREQLNAKK